MALSKSQTVALLAAIERIERGPSCLSEELRFIVPEGVTKEQWEIVRKELHSMYIGWVDSWLIDPLKNCLPKDKQ